MREVFDMNAGWRFHRGEITFRNHGGIHAERYDAAEWMKAGNQGVAQPSYPDEDWSPVDLPHDFVIDSGFTPEANLTHGSLPTGVGWYRKTFELPAEDAGKHLRLEFDGVYRDCQVWLNGHFVGRHLSGYTSFAFDITDMCHFGGINTVAVRTDAREFELWSYEGGGIYRDVRLLKTSPLHVQPDGVWAKCDNFEGTDPAEVSVELSASLLNASRTPHDCSVQFQVVSPAGEVVSTTEAVVNRLADFAKCDAVSEVVLPKPSLWSTESPQLYSLNVSVRLNDQVVDELTVRFGVRSVRFDAQTGFYLNGKPLKLKGVCNHQDHAGVGIAIPSALEDWRVQRVKAMGANAIRTAHNPAAPALLEACDRQGVLVLDEQRQMGVSSEHLSQLASLIRRDRNHPCIFAWSLGNEEMIVQHTEVGVRQFRRMQDLCHRMDPTRPVTYAMNCNWLAAAEVHENHEFRFDVYGANYVCRNHCDVTGELYDEFHTKYPDWPLLGTETGGSASTRGVYVKDDAQPGLTFNETAWWTNPKRRDVISAYGETCTPWGYSVEQTWKDCFDRPFLSGTFLWTGFDYRGETYPAKWPAVITCYGLMDLCGFPKDAYHYYRVWWNEAPAIHLFPHWNWEGKEGEPVEVWCYSNCAEVELALNGESLGRKPMPPREHLAWEVPYAPGQLVATGFDESGRAVQTQIIETTGPTDTVRLKAPRQSMSADGKDVVAVTVAAIDAEGRFVATDGRKVQFELTGPAQILGVGNGDPCSHELDRANERKLFKGLCQVLLKATRETGSVTLRAIPEGAAPVELSIEVNQAGASPWVPPVKMTSAAEVDGSDHAVNNAL